MKTITIVHLYAEEMNIYGDNGNVLVIQKRLEWRGFKTRVLRVGIGQELPTEFHMVIGGGGQDVGQIRVAKDLLDKQAVIKEHIDRGTPMLMICGMYQLFGDFFTTANGTKIHGIGVFPLCTEALPGRIIGNITTRTDWGEIIGYENHSGRTYLREGAKSLGVAEIGQGNNGKDGTEGVVKNNAYGSYLHGPILSKSPHFADHLIALALKSAGMDTEITPLDDSLAQQAGAIAASRPR